MSDFPEHFERQYQLHLKHLKLKGLQPKTIDAYARGMRRIGKYFLTKSTHSARTSWWSISPN